MIEETLRKQLEEKERIQVELENEIVSLRGKLQSKEIKQNIDNSTKILDQIISSQRSVYDKSGLGYNQNNTEMRSRSKVTENEKISYAYIIKQSSKKEECEPLKEDMQNLGMKKIKENDCALKKSTTTHNSELKRFEPVIRPPIPRYQTFFFDLCYSCNNYGQKAIYCRSYA